MGPRCPTVRAELLFQTGAPELVVQKLELLPLEGRCLYGSMAAGGIASSRRGRRKGLGEQTPLDCVEGEGQKPEGEENNVGSVGDKDEE